MFKFLKRRKRYGKGDILIKKEILDFLHHEERRLEEIGRGTASRNDEMVIYKRLEYIRFLIGKVSALPDQIEQAVIEGRKIKIGDDDEKFILEFVETENFVNGSYYRLSFENVNSGSVSFVSREDYVKEVRNNDGILKLNEGDILYRAICQLKSQVRS